MGDRHQNYDRGAKFSSVFLSNTDHPPEWAELGEEDIENVIGDVMRDFNVDGPLETLLKRVDDNARENAFDYEEPDPFLSAPTPSTMDPSSDEMLFGYGKRTDNASFPIPGMSGKQDGRGVEKEPTTHRVVTFAPIETVIDEENKEELKRQREKEAKQLAQQFAEQVSTRYSALITKMQARVEGLETMLNQAQRARRAWARQKQGLEDKIQDFEMEKTELQDTIDNLKEQAASQAGGGANFFSAGGAPGGKRGNVMSNFDFDVDQIDDADMALDEVKVTTVLKRMKILFERKVAALIPFEKDIRWVTKHYGQTFGHFFGFTRFLFFLACAIMVVYFPLTVPQMLGQYVSDDERISDTGWCGFAPCAFLLGGFYLMVENERDEGLALTYVAVSIVSAVAGLFLSLKMWASFDKAFQREILNEEMHRRKYAKVGFICWDFRLKTEDDKNSFGKFMGNQFKALEEEELLLEEERRRTKRERRLLYARRASGMFLNMIFIVGAWIAIGSATIYKHEISTQTQKLFSGTEAGVQVGDLAPNLVVSLVGGMLPTLTKIITDMEKWPPSTRLRQTMGRLYLGKILNVIIFALLNFERMVGAPMFGQSKVIVAREDRSFLCVENQAAASLFSLVVTEFLIGQIFRPVKEFLTAHVMHRVKNKFSKTTSPEKGGAGKVVLPTFEIPENVVNVTYFQGLIWIAMLLAPFTSLVAPILTIVNFKWMQLCLNRMYQVPGVAESSDIGVLILRLFCMTSAISLLFSILFLNYPFPHADGCGPFASTKEKMVAYSTAAITYIDESVPEDNKVLSFLHSAVQSSIFFIFLALWQFAEKMFKVNKVTVLRSAIDEVRVQSSIQVHAIDRDKRRLLRQNEVLQKRLEKFKKHEG